MLEVILWLLAGVFGGALALGVLATVVVWIASVVIMLWPIKEAPSGTPSGTQVDTK